MKRNKIILLFVFVLALAGCKTQDKASELNYMQNAEQIAIEEAISNQITTIQKGDNLAIFVMAKNMDVVKPFNQNYYSTQSSPTMNAPSSERIYIVDSEGNFDFPILGKIDTTGRTVEQIKDLITDKIGKYVKNPTITVRLTNFKVSVLGDVNKPGQYSFAEGNTTLLNALAIAGDLTLYGKRDDILVVRTENGEVTKGRINLMDANFINSPYFILKQNDVIYVSSNPTKDKISKQDPNTSIYIAVAGTLIGLAGIFITIFK